MKLGTSRHSNQLVMLIGGYLDGEVYTVRPDHLNGVLVALAEPTNARWEPNDEPYVMPKRELYYEQWFAAPDGWRQLAYVHSDLLSRLDSISETTIVAAVMKPWRAAHRRRKDEMINDGSA